jgi:hypothetical protein
MTGPTYAEMIAAVEKRHGAEAAFLAKHGFLIEEIGEDGDWHMAHGHIEPEQFVAAWLEWAREVWGLTPDDIARQKPEPVDVTLGHFTLNDLPAHWEEEALAGIPMEELARVTETGPYYDFSATAETPGAEPCTYYQQ